MAVNLEPDLQHRRDLLLLLIWAAFLGSFTLGAINFLRGLWTLALLEFAYGIFALSLLPRFRTTKHLRAWSVALSLPCFAMIMYAVYLPTTAVTIYVWVQTIPIFSYIMLGSRMGFWFSAFFVSLGTALYFRHLSYDLQVDNFFADMNVLVSSAVIMAFAHLYESRRERSEKNLLALAGTDLLTGLANRRRLESDFSKVSAIARRHPMPISLALIDLDHFKKINDRYGHGIGDDALEHSALLFASHIRTTDLVARLGGEEFVIVLLDCDKTCAAKKIDGLRQHFAENPLALGDDETLPMTFSAGIAEFGREGYDLESLLQPADRRLYIAKALGRDRVVSEDPPEDETPSVFI